MPYDGPMDAKASSQTILQSIDTKIETAIVRVEELNYNLRNKIDELLGDEPIPKSSNKEQSPNQMSVSMTESIDRKLTILFEKIDDYLAQQNRLRRL